MTMMSHLYIDINKRIYIYIYIS